MEKKSNGKEGKETRKKILPLTIQYGEEKQWERRERDKEKKKKFTVINSINLHDCTHYPIWGRKVMGKKGKRQGKKKKLQAPYL